MDFERRCYATQDSDEAGTLTSMQIDHITFAAPELMPLRETFRRAGLASEYGGPHSNGVTHMDLLGFLDGSYLELIAALDGVDTPSPLWDRHIRKDGGPCAWAVAVPDIEAEVGRLAAAGIPVEGPIPYHRRRPDGERVEWFLAFPGTEPPGATLPFLIQDITSRDLRARPTPGVVALSESGRDLPVRLEGVARVVLGVRDLEANVALFRKAYGWSEPRRPARGRAVFPDGPVVLESPDSEAPEAENQLARRLDDFGDSPTAFLIAVDCLEAVCERFHLAPPEEWLGETIAWSRLGGVAGRRLGFVELAPDDSLKT